MTKISNYSMIKMSIFQKLLIGIIGMLVLNAVIAFVGIKSVKKLELTAKIMLKKSKESNDLNALKLNFLQLLMPVHDFLVHGNKIEFKNFKKLDLILKNQITKSKGVSGVRFKQSFITDLEIHFKEVEFLSEEIFELKNPVGNQKGIIIMEDAEAIINKLINDLDEYLFIESQKMDQYLNTNQATYIKAARIIIIVGLILAFSLIFGGFLYVKEITQPIKQLSQMAKKVALGDLSVKTNIKTRTQDEIKDFSKSFNNMIGILEKTTVSRAYFNHVLNRMADTLIITDTTGKIKIVNKAAINLLEYTEEELLGKPFAEILSKDNENTTVNIANTISNLKERKGQCVQNTYYSKSGKANLVSFSRSVMYDRKRKVKGFLYVTQNNLDGFSLDIEQTVDSSKNGLKKIKTIGKNPLTKRELEIIKLITSEFSNREIADKLFISVRTVETHRKNIMQKLHTKSVIALVHYAFQNDIL